MPQPMDLVWQRIDDNWLMDTPPWQQQYESPDTFPNFPIIINRKSDKWKLPIGDEQCPDLTDPNRKTACLPTNQTPGIDYNSVHIGPLGVACTDGPHVNWFPATFHGHVFWKSHSPSRPGGDDDYNMLLIPELDHQVVRNGITGGSRENKDSVADDGTPGILMEFQAAETVDRMDLPNLTGWWQDFHHKGVDNRKVDDYIDKDKGQEVVATGLFNLDCEHSCHTELHPIWALAIKEKPKSPNEEVWAIFVRTFGNQGGCSQNSPLTEATTKPFGHYLDLLSNTFKFRLPLDAFGLVKVTGTDFKGVSKTGQFMPKVTSVQAGNEIVVAIDLGSKQPTDQPLAFGELHIHH